MGIPVRGPCYVYGDNKSVLINSSVQDYVLKKKSNSIAFHHTREGSARDEWRITYIKAHDNPANLKTKPLPYETACGRPVYKLFEYVKTNLLMNFFLADNRFMFSCRWLHTR